MICKQFESIVHEMGREDQIDPVTRRSALGHAEACPQCATRLVQEQSLIAGLNALAAETEKKEAPKRIESGLLAGFRQSRLAQGGPRPISRRIKGFRRWRWIPVAAAAGLLVGTLFAAYWVHMRTGLTGGYVVTSPVPASAREDQPRAVDTLPRAKPELVSHPRKFRSAGRSLASGRQRDTRKDSAIGRPDREIATDFYPLTYEAKAALDSALMVRVEVPRSTLTSFGLPMNVDRASEPVKADVLIGNDGLARAIRFVREPFETNPRSRIETVGSRRFP